MINCNKKASTKETRIQVEADTMYHKLNITDIDELVNGLDEREAWELYCDVCLTRDNRLIEKVRDAYLGKWGA